MGTYPLQASPSNPRRVAAQSARTPPPQPFPSFLPQPPPSKMGLSDQAIYVSMGLLSLAGLTGMGVAVGSGVAMMSMAETAKVNQAPTTSSPSSPKEKFAVPAA